MNYTIIKMWGYYHMWITKPIIATDVLAYVHKLQWNRVVAVHMFLTLEEAQQYNS